MFYFTSDEHYFHRNIIKYCDRPFSCLEEMHEELVNRYNELVTKDDITVHAGDFSLGKKLQTEEVIKRLNGNHIFLWGSHDKWLGQGAKRIWTRRFDGQLVVVCHYAMRTWPCSHYGAWQLYGHSHGNLPSIGKQWDIGVDNNNFYPVSFEQIKEIMDSRVTCNMVRR